MRHFRLELEALGHTVHYVTIDQGVSSLEEAVRGVVEHSAVNEVIVCEPGEYRLLDQMRATWSSALGVPVKILEDDRFLASHEDFELWARGKKQLRMEFFYRQMRQRYQLLMDDGQPAGATNGIFRSVRTCLSMTLRQRSSPRLINGSPVTPAI
jgi:deoxyribodipyrimidine photolyase-related protein